MTGTASPGIRLQRQTLVDSVYQHLLEAILSGRLPAGAELNEVALARDLGVSRTPVHEALAWLAADDLVEQAASRASVRKLSAHEVAELYEVRALLESAAAGRAAERIAAPVLQRLRMEARALSADAEAPDWPARAIDFDIRFHDQITAASGNDRLQHEIGRYRLLVRAFCQLTGHSKNLRDAMREHQAILKALEKRDPTTAAQAMATHIQNRLQAVLRDIYPLSKVNH